ncbi:diguanylate cyclase [Pseudooceanicola sp. CBS1P-1]|nr:MULTISPECIES: diguanylate cyclase [Pseudooceanicola]MBT9382976.1 diguanylate cyclase [Pseudooceanicola endophyticus]
MTTQQRGTGLIEAMRRFSLRTWLMLGMLVALLPVFVMGAVVYATFHGQIAQPFRSVLVAQHRVMLPLERLQGELWDLSTAVNDYADNGAEGFHRRFEVTEGEVARHLAALEGAIGSYGRYGPVLRSAEGEWDEVLKAAAAVQPGSPETSDPALQRFEDVVSETARRLEILSEDLRLENEQSHARALAAIRRLEYLAAGAAVLTLLFAVAAVQIIDRALINSTDRLVAGALSISSGDRTGQIDVTVPPELAKVANAFNAMTRQIVQQETALALAAETDSLTGLNNRRAFDRVLHEQVDKLGTPGNGFALMMLDVDHFKRFNDTHGHLAGDEALRQVAESLASEARESDMVFRYGGEEFAVVLPGLRAEDAFSAAERVRQTVARRGVVLPGGERIAATVSIGVVAPLSAGSSEQVVARADRALYAAKSGGRNQVISDDRAPV